MMPLTNKQILLIVTGSIAAYKAPDIINRLKDLGAQVRVILTENGAKFITKLSLEITSGHVVYHNLWDESQDNMLHIKLAKWADAILVSPASANFIAQIASGNAQNLATNVLLAAKAHLIIAPVMNQIMLRNPATQENLKILKKRNITVIKSEYGKQACGDVGAGRLPASKVIAKEVSKLFKHGALGGKRILLTAGATREAIDPVRFISNHSSGKMAVALTNALISQGAHIDFIYSNITEELPLRATHIAVSSALEMREAVLAHIKAQDIFIAVAAVCDYRPEVTIENKIKRSNKERMLTLVANPDILGEVCQLKNKPFSVGFAAQSDNLLENARIKFQEKNCDMLVVNDISRSDIGFYADENEVYVLYKKTQIKLEKNSKKNIARSLTQLISKNFTDV